MGFMRCPRLFLHITRLQGVNVREKPERVQVSTCNSCYEDIDTSPMPFASIYSCLMVCLERRTKVHPGDVFAACQEVQALS